MVFSFRTIMSGGFQVEQPLSPVNGDTDYLISSSLDRNNYRISQMLIVVGLMPGAGHSPTGLIVASLTT